MKSLRYIIIAFLLTSFGLGLNGQKTFQPKANDFDWKGIIYRKERAYEIRAHNNGLLFGTTFGKIRTYYKTTYYSLNIGILKDPREKRQNKNESFNFPHRSKSFAFGKQNSIFNIRGGMGVKRFISEKADRKGIAIGYDYTIGPSLALVKPYYLELKYLEGEEPNPVNQVIRTEKYNEANADKFTNHADIFGGTSYFKGFNELSVIPGIQGKLGLFFSLGAFDKYVKSVETGVMADLYIKKLPIMVETEEISNKWYFLNFYVNFLFGKRTN